jgi:hypothetical protein
MGMNLSVQQAAAITMVILARVRLIAQISIMMRDIAIMQCKIAAGIQKTAHA